MAALLMKFFARSRSMKGNKIRTTDFPDIGSAFPTSGQNREQVLANLDYLQSELRRWDHSIAYVSISGKHTEPLTLMENMWATTRDIANDENASTIDDQLRLFPKRFAGFACTVVYTYEQSCDIKGNVLFAIIDYCEALIPLCTREEDALPLRASAALAKAHMYALPPFVAKIKGGLPWTEEESRAERRATSDALFKSAAEDARARKTQT